MIEYSLAVASFLVYVTGWIYSYPSCDISKNCSSFIQRFSIILPLVSTETHISLYLYHFA